MIINWPFLSTTKKNIREGEKNLSFILSWRQKLTFNISMDCFSLHYYSPFPFHLPKALAPCFFCCSWIMNVYQMNFLQNLLTSCFLLKIKKKLKSLFKSKTVPFLKKAWLDFNYNFTKKSCFNNFYYKYNALQKFAQEKNINKDKKKCHKPSRAVLYFFFRVVVEESSYFTINI